MIIPVIFVKSNLLTSKFLFIILIADALKSLAYNVSIRLGLISLAKRIVLKALAANASNIFIPLNFSPNDKIKRDFTCKKKQNTLLFSNFFSVCFDNENCDISIKYLL